MFGRVFTTPFGVNQSEVGVVLMSLVFTVRCCMNCYQKQKLKLRFYSLYSRESWVCSMAASFLHLDTNFLSCTRAASAFSLRGLDESILLCAFETGFRCSSALWGTWEQQNRTFEKGLGGTRPLELSSSNDNSDWIGTSRCQSLARGACGSWRHLVTQWDHTPAKEDVLERLVR